MPDRMIISVEELQAKLNGQERIFILDIRPPDQRHEWRIAESVHLDAYARLKAGDHRVLDEVNVPADTAVVTVCAAGRTSLIAAEALRAKGIPARSLEGGMKAWNYAWNSAEVTLPNDLKIIQVRRAAKGCLSYVVGSENEAVVIDAALDPSVYMKIASDNGWKIRYVADTHIHADYISRTRELARHPGAEHVLIQNAKVGFSYTPLMNGDSISFGKCSLEILHTPGHTLESTSFKLQAVAVFTGDTLFTDGVGRPDLKANEHEAIEKSKSLYRSLKTLLALPPSVMVFPAHTGKTVSFDSKMIYSTIGELEKMDLLKMGEQEFIHYTTTRIPPTPPNYQTIATLNAQGSFGDYNPADLEAGGNHCAVK